MKQTHSGRSYQWLCNDCQRWHVCRSLTPGGTAGRQAGKAAALWPQASVATLAGESRAAGSQQCQACRHCKHTSTRRRKHSITIKIQRVKKPRGVPSLRLRTRCHGNKREERGGEGLSVGSEVRQKSVRRPERVGHERGPAVQLPAGRAKVAEHNKRQQCLGRLAWHGGGTLDPAGGNQGRKTRVHLVCAGPSSKRSYGAQQNQVFTPT